VGETADQIRDQIEAERQELGDNLEHLERKVRDTVNWRTQYDQHPMAMVGAAFAGGFVLSMMLGGGSKTEPATHRSRAKASSGATEFHYSPAADTMYGSVPEDQPVWQPTTDKLRSKPRSPEMNEIQETLDNIRGALLGLGATKLRSVLAESLPGFGEEYDEAARKRHSSPESSIDERPASSDSRSSDVSTTTGVLGMQKQQPTASRYSDEMPDEPLDRQASTSTMPRT
jgi:hypothetical protein